MEIHSASPHQQDSGLQEELELDLSGIDLPQLPNPEDPPSHPDAHLKRILSHVGCAAAGAALVAGTFLWPKAPSERFNMPEAEPMPHTPAEVVISPSLVDYRGDELSNVANVLQRVAPAIVHIDVARPSPNARTPFDLLPQQNREMIHITGSGFVVDSGGYIVTNHHVIKDGKEIGVTFSDGTRLLARVVGSDPLTDIAVLRVTAGKALPTVKLGDSDALKQGEWVVAYGNPLGLENSATIGIVSALGRSAGDLGIENVLGFIQVDAAINPGNSGGPLLNLKGEVVGINDAVLKNAQNIGFAIPISGAKRVINELKTTGTARHSYIGVEILDLTPAVLDKLKTHATLGPLVKDLEPGAGTMVTKVHADSPAARAGIREGDIIATVDGLRVTGDGMVRRVIDTHPPGDKVRLTLRRQGKELAVVLTTAERRATGNISLTRSGDEPEQ